MKRILFIVIYGTTWFALIAGALQISKLPIADGHAFCGPWGCLPQPNALLSVHALWASLIIPLTVLLVWASNMARIRLIWKIGLATSLAILIGFVGYDAWNYVFNFDGEVQHLWRRGLFRVVTATDFPVVQVSLAFALGWLLTSSAFPYNEARTSRNQTTESSQPQTCE